MTWILAISIALLGYIYAGYPALIGLWARWRPRPVRKGPFAGGVSVLIAAHNEADALPRKLDHLLDLARTEPIREIRIGLDGCTDGTAARVQEKIRISNVQCSSWEKSATCHLPPSTCNLSPAPEIHLLEFEFRRGKAAVLNDLMGQATPPIFNMMDARQRVEPGAVSRLLENFADDRVGVVSGELFYESAAGAAQKGAESYWGYEKFIRLIFGDLSLKLWVIEGFQWG